MEDVPIPSKEIVSRLKKAEGQLRGIAKMVLEERDCIDIMIQLSATKSALESVAALVLQNYTSVCAARSEEADIGADLARAVSIWIGGRV
ncbi:metal-sensitive transcriptional regulator [Chloroflexota bacterium]